MIQPRIAIHPFVPIKKKEDVELHPFHNMVIVSVTCGAAVESFYRAALNSILNQSLTGVRMDKLFPNMKVQLPFRILYFNGFKGIRWYLDHKVHPEKHKHPSLVSLGMAITPGLCMTPASSILEACNAGHANPEPLIFRATRGLLPRTGREILFGLGLNQLSDNFENRMRKFANPTLANSLGSFFAGIVSGYFSHVAHNLSTLKLMNPHKTYAQHFQDYVKSAETRLPNANWSLAKRHLAAFGLAILLPKGILIRTAQIAGSFIILNTIIHVMT